MSESSFNKRNENIDIIKGIAVILMVYGHCLQYGVNGKIDYFDMLCFKIVYSFHMPLFTIVSGYLLGKSLLKYNLKDIFNKKINTLVYPIITCNILKFYSIYGLILLFTKPLKLLTLDGLWLMYFNGYWFLWNILASTIVVVLIIKTNILTITKY